MKKMNDYKDTFFLTNFEDELKLRCSDFYYMPNKYAFKLLNDIKLGVKSPSEFKTYIKNRYSISKWLILLEKHNVKDIAEYSVDEIFIDGKECYAFDIEVAYHQ